MAVRITQGDGSASVASELIGNNQYQQIKVIGGETGSTSVLGVNPDRSINVSVIGQVQMAGSVLANVGAGSIITVAQGSILANIGAGSIIAVQQGSILANIGAGSIITVSTGSVITVFQSSSLIAINAGSVVAVPVGSVITTWQSPSIVGTYAEDAAHATGDKGLQILGVRNDLMPSVTSADLDYSPVSVGPVGEVLTANAPITKWVRGTADMRGVGALGGSVVVVAAQGASVFTYITSAQFVNIGGASVLVTIAGGLGSVLGYTIAPAGGGSNILYPNALKTGENSAVTASISGVASVLVSLQGFTAKI